ncbi:hypothetical protein [Streptomyces sp. NPDC000410]|uniref:hypothetical protein n=1 Tax=Streptomyces sp. NPDC000410 TaxID=3154254 RepID=UPI00332725D8
MALNSDLDHEAVRVPARQFADGNRGGAGQGVPPYDSCTHHPQDSFLEETVRLLVLVDAAVKDEGKRMSVHLADQDGILLVVVLSHTGAQPDGTILTRLASVTGTVSCSADACDEGRRIWSLLSTEPPQSRTPTA